MLRFVKTKFLLRALIAIALLWVSFPLLSIADEAEPQKPKHHLHHKHHKTTTTTTTTVTTHTEHHHTHHQHHVKHHIKKHKVEARSESEESDDTQNTIMEEAPYTDSTVGTPTTADFSQVDQNTSSGSYGIVATMEKHLVNFVHKTVTTLRYSAYKLGGKKFDPSRGVYVVDCSNFVDNILQTVSPHAYNNLVNATGTDTPTTLHYYQFFSGLGSDSDYWSKVDGLDQLRAGDILVFRSKNSRGAQTGGHVMVVMDKPIRDANVFFVRVADSAPARHSKDTRQLNESGIGIGTLLLKANPKTGRPDAYAWREGSYWKKNVSFAMARPTDIS